MLFRPKANCSRWAWDSGCERLFRTGKKIIFSAVRSTSCCRSITINAMFTRVIFNFPQDESDEIWLENVCAGLAAGKKGWERLLGSEQSSCGQSARGTRLVSHKRAYRRTNSLQIRFPPTSPICSTADNVPLVIKFGTDSSSMCITLKASNPQCHVN
jgi:hypothetical protein